MDSSIFSKVFLSFYLLLKERSLGNGSFLNIKWVYVNGDPGKFIYVRKGRFGFIPHRFF
jgi:hypothetical protein